ncbi:hypothetical protein [Pantoea sp.]|uniref:hypothetical protein n=1 Tax=Pantoea sp. TaxID=69393 RepID=UPI0028A85E69|nr:hypothetical protein [Pantoea sp.]
MLLAQPAKTNAANRGNNSFFNILFLVGVRGWFAKTAAIIALPGSEKSPAAGEIVSVIVLKGFAADGFAVHLRWVMMRAVNVQITNEKFTLC